MSFKKGQYNYLYFLIGVVITGLICIQLYWINKTIEVEKNALNRSLNNDFEKLADKIEEYAYCYILYAKTYINKNEGIYLVKQQVDSNGIYVSPEKGGIIDTVNLFNFRFYNGDTVFENYSSLELRSFAASLDVTFNFAFEGVKDRSQYDFKTLTSQNIAQAFDNTMNIASAIDKRYLDTEIKAVLKKNGLDTNYAAGIRKANSRDFVLVTDSSKDIRSCRNIIEVAFFENHVSDPYLLVIGVPQPFTKIVKSLSVMMISSVVIILMLIFSFTYFVRTIINERKLSEMKNAFINNMTHEFRTPITNISLAIENWRETRKSTDFYLDIIEEENKHMEKNVDQILELATLRHNEPNAPCTQVNIHEVIKKAMDSFKMQLSNVNGSITLDLNVKSPFICAHEREMLNMIQNLLDNAIKYRRDKPEIKISTYQVGNDMVIEIEDNGIGMSAETQQHIFERFYRSDTGDRHDVKGFGLGMSYVKQIIDNHKGQIDIKSKPGKGSAFIIHLPINKKTS